MYGIIFNGFNPVGAPDASRAGGGYRIATHLRKQGWDIEVVDYLAFWLLEDLIALIEKRHSRFTIKWIGLSATWIFRHPNVQGIIDYVKKTYPEIKIIVGGNSNFNTDVKADYYVYGFGEHAADAILKYEFGNGKKPYGTPHYKGWTIDALHFYPAWPLENYTSEYQARDFLVETDNIALEIGRGCKFKCKFCNFPVLGVKEDTSMSEEIMYEHFRTMYDQWGVKTYSIADETTNDRTIKLVKIAGAVQRCEFAPNFNAFIRLDLFQSNPEQIELIAGARIWGQFYGMETFNHRSGKIIGKGLAPEKNKELMLKTRKYMLEHVGMYRGTASFIAGLPHETPDTLKITHEWLSNNWTDQNWLMFALTIPQEKNFRLSVFGEDFAKYGYERMSQEEIQKTTGFETDTAFGSNEVEGGGRQAFGMFMLDQVIWKNQYGNYFDFHRLAEQYDSLYGSTSSKLGNFDVFANLSLGGDLTNVLNLPSNCNQQPFHDMANSKISAYIQKKIAW